MSAEETIRLKFPQSLAKLYEAVGLEGAPELRVIKLLRLFEETVRQLSLVGLAGCIHRNLVDDKVAAARADLGRPSLGHWVALLKAVSLTLQNSDLAVLTPPLDYRLKSDSALMQTTVKLAASTGFGLPDKVRLLHFLDAMGQFRNKKHGHGTLSAGEAKQLVTPLEAGMLEWLAGLTILQRRKLVYIDRCEWEPPTFSYIGTDLNSGTSLYPASFQGSQPVAPKQVYLGPTPDLTDREFIRLHPFFAFDKDNYLLYSYNELSTQEQPVLRCAYDSSGQHDTLVLDAEASAILGNGQKPAPALSQPEPISSAGNREAKDIIMDTPGMQNWYDIIPPHEDIRRGNFDEAVFAADLGDVADGVAPPDYGDPYLFFKKTYPTRGLQSLLGRVQETLTTGRGSSVIQIQTPFGGGKTHALVAIYHYLTNGHRVAELLPAGLKLLSPRVAVVAGNHWDPLAGRKTNGVTRRTFWGEIAYQIGGAAGYEAFRANDEARVSPGKDKLRDFLAAHQPFILLFDEILEYINRALDARAQGAVDVSLGTQTFSFFQELTEAVAAIPKGMLVVTLPSSHLEDFSERQEESLARLSKIFGRVESIETPVQGEEVYAVIRRRLFEVEKLKQAPMREVVHRYFQLYQQNRDDVPPKAREISYRERMELAYPFHPDVIDILYEKWSTYSTFQRTRGVLRLLANVIEDLYQREVGLDLILPGDINLGKPSIRQEFLKHIGSEYEGVIGSDIAGHDAKAQSLDNANRPWKHLAQRISTAVFFHSFSADASEKGVNLPYIKLAVLHSDTMPAMVTELLGKLANILWYLNSRGDAYYFSRIPNLNRMILDKKELYNESYEPELRKTVEKEVGSKFRVYLWPADGEGIPDNRDLKLVILRPDDSGMQIPEWIERRGASFREYKNTLFFALADTAAFGRLREDIKAFLALRDIKEEMDSGQSPLPEEKRAEVQRRTHDVQRDFSYNVRRMYHVVRFGNRAPVNFGEPVAGNETLGSWYWRELTSGDIGAVTTHLHYRLIVNKFMVNNDQLATGVLLDQFYKNPDLPALSEPGVLARAVQLGIQEGAFGLVETTDGTVLPDSLRFRDNLTLDAVSFDPGVHLISRQRAEAIIVAKETAQSAIKDAEKAPGETIMGSTSVRVAEPREAYEWTSQPAESYHRVRMVIANVPAGKIADVNRGILLPFSQAVGNFTFTLTIDVQSAEGIDRSTLENKVKETIRQIGATLVDEQLE